MIRLKKFIGLQWQEQRLLLESCLLLAIAVVGVRLVSFRLLQRWAGGGTTPDKRVNSFSEEKICWSISAARRIVPGSTCLTEALAMQLLLRQCGYASSIRVGVRKTPNGDFSAHAWVENDGRIIFGQTQEADKFERLPAF